MSIYTLKEGDWGSFVQKNILPLCVSEGTAKVFALVGDLGAGKTTFSKMFLKSLGVAEHIQSPTFSIINSYDIEHGTFKKVFHIDVYRIEDSKELEVLHFKEILDNPEHLVVIEWADTIKQLIPSDATWITFAHDTLETRNISIQDGKN